MPRAITGRHDSIVQVLANMFKRVGEVNIEVKCDGETRVRPDIEIVLSDRSLLVDVAVVLPPHPGEASQPWPLPGISKTRNWRSTKQWPRSGVVTF